MVLRFSAWLFHASILMCARSLVLLTPAAPACPEETFRRVHPADSFPVPNVQPSNAPTFTPPYPTRRRPDVQTFRRSDVLRLSPLLATDPKKRRVSPIIATLPKTIVSKSFACHTCRTPPGGSIGISLEERIRMSSQNLNLEDLGQEKERFLALLGMTERAGRRGMRGERN
jgi:hypothetical protein